MSRAPGGSGRIFYGMTPSPPALTPRSPLAAIATAWPAALDVFERLDIRYASNGTNTLADAADEAGIRIADLMESLAEVTAAPPAGERSLLELVSMVLPSEHAEIRRQFDLLDASLDGPDRSESAQRIARIFRRLMMEVFEHMAREEHELIPAIHNSLTRMDRSRRDASLGQRILIEFVEHDRVVERLSRLRQLTMEALLADEITPELAAQLTTFERTLLRHVHMENNILLPGVLEAERDSRSG
jgi:iron-sulfur cluster repair protein YtfE (RIC family)